MNLESQREQSDQLYDVMRWRVLKVISVACALADSYPFGTLSTRLRHARNLRRQVIELELDIERERKAGEDDDAT
jgi:hypothetical protein